MAPARTSAGRIRPARIDRPDPVPDAAEGQAQAARAVGVQDRPVAVVVEEAGPRGRQAARRDRRLPEAQLGVGAEVGVVGDRGSPAAGPRRRRRPLRRGPGSAWPGRPRGPREGVGPGRRRRPAAPRPTARQDHLRDGRVGVELGDDGVAAGVAGTPARDRLVEGEARVVGPLLGRQARGGGRGGERGDTAGAGPAGAGRRRALLGTGEAPRGRTTRTDGVATSRLPRPGAGREPEARWRRETRAHGAGAAAEDDAPVHAHHDRAAAAALTVEALQPAAPDGHARDRHGRRARRTPWRQTAQRRSPDGPRGDARPAGAARAGAADAQDRPAAARERGALATRTRVETTTTGPVGDRRGDARVGGGGAGPQAPRRGRPPRGVARRPIRRRRPARSTGRGARGRGSAAAAASAVVRAGMATAPSSPSDRAPTARCAATSPPGPSRLPALGCRRGPERPRTATVGPRGGP